MKTELFKTRVPSYAALSKSYVAETTMPDAFSNIFILLSIGPEILIVRLSQMTLCDLPF